MVKYQATATAENSLPAYSHGYDTISLKLEAEMNIFKTLTLIFGIILAIVTIFSESAFSQYTPATWPTTWTPVRLSNNVIAQDPDDIQGTSSGHLDLYYSDSPHSATAQVAYENNTFFFRIQLQGSPGTVLSLASVTWVAQIKNLNTGTVGAVLLDGVGEVISVSKLTAPTAEDQIYVKQGKTSPFNNAVRISNVWSQPTITSVANSADNCYLDFQVPIAALDGGNTQLGITSTTPIQLFFGTSSAAIQTGVINKDWMIGGTVNWGSVNSTTLETIGGGPLPVELSSFQAYLKNGVTELHWSTATETNNHGFNVLRSTDGDSWNEIGFVQGAGNSQVPLYYSFSDTDLPHNAAAVYYRLRQVDRDGTTDYSSVTMVHNRGVHGVEITDAYPNPFNPTTTVSFSLDQGNPVRLSLFDMTGKEVNVMLDNVDLNAGSHAVTVNAGTLPSGRYLCVLQTAHTRSMYPVMLMK